MATIDVKDATGVTKTIEQPLAPGQATMAASRPVVIASNQSAVGVKLTQSEYETVAASQTAQTLGASGEAGDYLASLLVIPATTSPGAISIKDGGNTAITVFAGGASSVSTLHPFSIPLGVTSTAGGWQVTTGTNVSAIGIGDFT